MSEEHRAVVFRTPSAHEAAAVRAALDKAGIPSESQVAVPADREEEALRFIESLMADAGIKLVGGDEPETPPENAGFPCPNCEAPGAMLGGDCGGCAFAVNPPPGELPPLVLAHEPGAKTFCPECRSALTFEWGACRSCGVEVEPLEKADRFCPSLAHVLYRDTVGGLACKACKAVWVSAP